MNDFLTSIHHFTSDTYRIMTHDSYCWRSFKLTIGFRFEDRKENYNGFTFPEPDIVVLISGCPR